MQVVEHDDRRTEFGRDPDTGKYLLVSYVRGEEVLRILADNKESALSAARISLLHELVRRDDIRELGEHPRCEGCEFEEKLQGQLKENP